MSDGGKGSKPRPIAIPLEEYDKKYSAIFGESPLERKLREQREKERELQQMEQQ
jgi:hypothetical protein